jgi:hypothetical protein
MNATAQSMTSTKSYTVLELLGTGLQEGQKAKVSTDNSLYGITVVKHQGKLLNDRDGSTLPLTNELLKTKFRLVNTERKVTFDLFLLAYQEGKKLKIVMGKNYRFIQKGAKEENEIPNIVNDILNMIVGQEGKVAQSTSASEAMSFEELINGEFYILD